MKKILCFVILIPFGFLLGCNAQEQPKGSANTNTINANTTVNTAAPKKISAAQAKAIMDGNDPYTLVDVRTEAEYREARIKGAVLIPVDEIASRAAAELPDKNAVIIVYCRSGVRASRAADILAGMGYTNVNNMGGIMSWPYDTVSN